MIVERILGQLNIFKRSAGSSFRPFKGADTVVVSPLFLLLPFCVGGGRRVFCKYSTVQEKCYLLLFVYVSLSAFLCLFLCDYIVIDWSVIILSLSGL